MKYKSRAMIIGIDMYTVQMMWTVWYLCISLLVHLFQAFIATRNGIEISDFYIQTSLSGNIYMFVIGIISGYTFLTFYVQNGVTRKNFFKGATIAAFGLSITIPIIAVVISLLETWIVNITNLSIIFESSIDVMDEDISHPIVRAILSFISASFADRSNGWAISLIGTVISYFFHYLCGWFISSGFYSKGVIFGLSIIALVIVFYYFSFHFITTRLIFFFILLSVVVLSGIRLLTKNVTIKL